MMKDMLGEDLSLGDYVIYSPRDTTSIYAGEITRETAMQFKVKGRYSNRTVDKRHSKFEVLKITKEQYERING